MVMIGRFNYEKSDKPFKKLMVKVGNRVVHFGDTRYKHFRDATKVWSKLDHNDEQRRKQYLSRTAGIRDGDNRLTKDNPRSPNYHSRRILWAA